MSGNEPCGKSLVIRAVLYATILMIGGIGGGVWSAVRGDVDGIVTVVIGLVGLTALSVGLWSEHRRASMAERTENTTGTTQRPSGG